MIAILVALGTDPTYAWILVFGAGLLAACVGVARGLR